MSKEINLIFDLNKNYKHFIDKNEEIVIEGWIKTNRSSGKIGFINLTDGTSTNIQIVYKSNQISNFEEVSKLTIWSAIKIVGNLVLKKDVNDPYEINANTIEVLATSSYDFPLQKKEHSLEFLREISHLRARSNLFNAVMRIRSEAAFAIHNFYHSMRFLYLTSPEITENDGEGAGENFIVNSREKKNFFGDLAYLTVSGQLHGEAYAQAFKNIYTFGPTFRAENSHTNRHISEFWMIEPEMAFKTKDYGIKIAEENIKCVINHILINCHDELKICANKTDKNLIEKLKKYLSEPFGLIDYKDAIELLLQHQELNKVDFENKNIFFGMDLNSEHEKYICENIFNKPVFITNYPKEIKAFYMKLNEDNKTVAAFDCLIPGIGEVVGGSERESDLNKMKQRCMELNINIDKLNWYIDLRKYGYYKSVGFGLGFERLIMMLTGMENVRDVIPFPRYPGSIRF